MNRIGVVTMGALVVGALVFGWSAPTSAHTVAPSARSTAASTEISSPGPNATLSTVLSAEQPAPNPGHLVQFPTLKVGWLIRPGESPIYHTTNGGIRWRNSYKGTLQPRSIDAIGTRDAWAIAVTIRNEPAGLLRTTDGGAHWKVLAEPPAAVLSAIDFLNPTAGWALTTNDVVLSTTDGGRLWNAVTTPEPARSLCVTTAGRIWFAGGESAGVYTSADSGVTWDQSLAFAQVPQVPATLPSTIIPWLTCSGSAAWAIYDWGEAAGSAAYVILATANNGSNWAPQFANRDSSVSGLPSVSATLMNAGTTPGGFAWFLGSCGPCGEFGSVETVTVAGTSTPDTTQLSDLSGASVGLDASFVDSKHGWVVGTPKKTVGHRPSKFGYPTSIYATTDGGKAWRQVGTIPTPH